jgi:hypothetical protein
MERALRCQRLFLDYSRMEAKRQVYFAIREVYKQIRIFDSLALGIGGKGANTMKKVNNESRADGGKGLA